MHIHKTALCKPICPRTRTVVLRKSRNAVSRTASSDVAAVPTGKRDMTAGILESAVKLVLRSRLTEYEDIHVDVCCDAKSLLQGEFNGMKVVGKGWETPMKLTANLLEVDIGQLCVDLSTLLWRRQVQLKNVPEGSVRIILGPTDLGNFMGHPLMQAAAATAIQGEPFVFHQDSVTFCKEGVQYLGEWNCGVYDITMTPVDTNGSQGSVTALRVSSQPVPGGNGTAAGAEYVAVGLGQFFGGMSLNLQGILIQNPVLVSATSQSGEPLLEIQMKVLMKAFPPMDFQF